MVMHALLLLAVLLYGRVSGRPEQMHLSYAREPNSMWATWVVVGGHPAPPDSASTDQLCLLQEDHAHGGEGKEHIVRGVRASTYRENRTGCRSEGTYGEGCTPWNGTIYTAHFRGLVLHRTYAYTCGSASLGMTPSRRFTFSSSADPDIARTVTFAMFGDQGSFSSSNPNGGMPAFNDTYPGAKLVRDSLLAAARPAGARGEEGGGGGGEGGGGGGGDGIQFLAVVGDVAYANGNQPVWDAYSRDMEPLWSTIPALVTPGNHDGEFTFGNPYEQRGPGGGDSGIAYALRFPGPGHTIRYTSRHTGPMSSTSLYWSRNEGPVHLIGLAGVLGFERGAAQYEWLEKDLREAAEPATRASRPWIVVTIHYPLYCTLRAEYCNTPNTPAGPFSFWPENHRVEKEGRTGEKKKKNKGPDDAHPHPSIFNVTGERLRAALEPLLLEYGVDAVFAGHNHNYERTHPVRNATAVSRGKRVVNAWGDAYTEYASPAGAPLHWVVGTGGADPNPVGDWRNETGTPSWVARRLYDDREAGDETNNWGWARVRATKEELAVAFVDAVRNRTLDRVVLRRR